MKKSPVKDKSSANDSERPLRVYCDGIYDLFHFGHARQLRQAKMAFKEFDLSKVNKRYHEIFHKNKGREVYLLVGVCSDADTHHYKGRTVMTHDERVESLKHCKYVDQVIENAPWIIDNDFIIKYDIDFVAHDDLPYTSADQDDVYAFVKDSGKFIPTQRTDGISTSDLITRIVKDYDVYVRRNLARGVDRKDLGLTRVGVTGVKLYGLIKDTEDLVKKNWNSAKDDLFPKEKDGSRDFIKGFLHMFDFLGRDQNSVVGFLKRAVSPQRIDLIQSQESDSEQVILSQSKSAQYGDSKQIPSIDTQQASSSDESPNKKRRRQENN